MISKFTKLSFLFILLTYFQSKAQPLNTNKDYTQVMDTILAPLGQNYRTTNIRYERSAPFANLLNYKDTQHINGSFLDQA